MGKQKQQGVAVVTILWTTLIIGGLLAVVGINVVRQLGAAKNNQTRNEMVSLADSISEQARLTLYDQLKTGNKTAITFLNELRNTVGAGTYPVNQVTLDGGVKGAWTVRKVSAATAEYGWVDIHATVRRGTDKQTVVRRISLGQNGVFKLAMLTETVNCMFCHFRVNGDVGTYQKFRPGWGADTSDTVAGTNGTNSGAGSNINGSVYSAAAVMAASRNLNSNPKVINGTTVTGDVQLNYKGDMLPKDASGTPAFPPIKKAVALANATGSAKMTGDGTGRIIGLPFGTNYSNMNTNRLTGGINKTYNGNVILVGTATDPIRLDQDIYVTGDVIIKGYVTGRGGIYAGRNMYIAGNLMAANPPDAPNVGICAGITDKTACAKKNIAAGKDELRAAARANIVVGDYTRFNGTATRTADDRQSHEFMEAQFGFTNNKFFSRITGEEVICDASGNNCRDTEGNGVANTDRFARSGARATNLQDGYSMAMRPGVVNGANASFAAWMTDAQYANEMLTYENDTFRSWRSEFSRGSGATTAQRDALVAAGIPLSVANTINNLLANNQNGSGNVNNIDGVTGYYRVDGTTVRFMRDTVRSYKKQITKVDAFLYANQRIGGVILDEPAEFNGGMIAREIGILAPGKEEQWWYDISRYDNLKNLSNCKTIAPNSEDCAMTLNYDHRLQAGGYGYNMVGGQVGQTSQWKLSGDPADDVAVN